MAWPFRNLSRLTLSSIAFLSVGAGATTVQSYWQNRKGIQQLQQKNYRSAYQTFMKGLEDDPLNPALQMNLGLTFEINEEYPKAEQAYRGVLKLVPDKSEMQFAALFNLGEALGKEKRVPEALQAYQLALEIRPDSKEVKTNIELLWQQGGGGGGKGDPKDKDQKGKEQQKQGQGDGDKDKKDQDKKDQQNPDPKDKDQKAKPHPFDSKDLSDQDVKKILDEIKNQEQAIRAQEYERNPKEAPRGKDW